MSVSVTGDDDEPLLSPPHDAATRPRRPTAEEQGALHDCTSEGVGHDDEQRAALDGDAGRAADELVADAAARAGVERLGVRAGSGGRSS